LTPEIDEFDIHVIPVSSVLEYRWWRETPRHIARPAVGAKVFQMESYDYATTCEVARKGRVVYSRSKNALAKEKDGSQDATRVVGDPF